MPVFDDIAVKNEALVRKGLDLAVFIAPMTSTFPTALTDAAGELVVLPAGYVALGQINEDGASWARETEVSDIYGIGTAEPVRSDIRRATKRLTVVPLETNITVLSQYLGVDLSAITTSAGGESVIDEPGLPPFNYVRLVAIGKDVSSLGGGNGEYYLGRGFPRARVTEVAEEVWADGDTALQHSLTFTAFQDPTLGTASRYYFGGQGRDAEAEGFPAES
jgi:hypothetical protein